MRNTALCCTWQEASFNNPAIPSHTLGRGGHADACLGDCIYIYGGRNRSGPLNDFWRFNVNTGNWQKLAEPCTKARAGATLTCIERELVLIGGICYDTQGNGKSHLCNGDVLVYSPDTNAWRTISISDGTVLLRRAWHVATQHPTNSGVVVLVAGYGKGSNDKQRDVLTYLNDVVDLHVPTGKVTQVETVGECRARCFHGGALLREYIVVVGGRTQMPVAHRHNGETRSEGSSLLVEGQDCVEVYHVPSGKWCSVEQSGDAFPCSRSSCTVTAASDSSMIMFGGTTATQDALNDSWALHVSPVVQPEPGAAAVVQVQWVALQGQPGKRLPQARAQHSLTVVKQTAYLVGGSGDKTGDVRPYCEGMWTWKIGPGVLRARGSPRGLEKVPTRCLGRTPLQQPLLELLPAPEPAARDPYSFPSTNELAAQGFMGPDDGPTGLPDYAAAGKQPLSNAAANGAGWRSCKRQRLAGAVPASEAARAVLPPAESPQPTPAMMHVPTTKNTSLQALLTSNTGRTKGPTLSSRAKTPPRGGAQGPGLPSPHVTKSKELPAILRTPEAAHVAVVGGSVLLNTGPRSLKRPQGPQGLIQGGKRGTSRSPTAKKEAAWLARVNELESELQQARTEQSEAVAQAAQARVSASEAVAERDRQLDALQQQLQQQQQQSMHWHHEVQRQQQHLKQQDERLKQQEQSHNTLQQQFAQLQQELASSRQAAREHQQQYRQAELRYEQMHDTAVKKDKERMTAEQQLSDERKALHELQSSHGALIAAHKQLGEELITTKQQAESKDRDFQLLQRESKQTLTTLGHLREKLKVMQELEQLCERNQSAIVDMTREKEEVCKERDNLAKQKRETDDQLTSLQHQLQAHKQESARKVATLMSDKAELEQDVNVRMTEQLAMMKAFIKLRQSFGCALLHLGQHDQELQLYVNKFSELVQPATTSAVAAAAACTEAPVIAREAAN